MLFILHTVIKLEQMTRKSTVTIGCTSIKNSMRPARDPLRSFKRKYWMMFIQY